MPAPPSPIPPAPLTPAPIVMATLSIPMLTPLTTAVPTPLRPSALSPATQDLTMSPSINYTLPLRVSQQVPLVVTPPLDKPEEPPPACPMDKATSPHTPKLCKATLNTSANLAHAPTTLHSDDKHHQRQVDPGGSNLKPPGRYKACTCCSLGMHISDRFRYAQHTQHTQHTQCHRTVCVRPYHTRQGYRVSLSCTHASPPPSTLTAIGSTLSPLQSRLSPRCIKPSSPDHPNLMANTPPHIGCSPIRTRATHSPRIVGPCSGSPRHVGNT